MATEGPNLHDGAVVAAGNYSNNQSLAGPNGSGQYLAVTLSTSADRTVALAAATGAQCYGILQSKPAGAGQSADVAILGITKAVAGGTITRGATLMTNASGQVVAWTAGSSYAQIGYALESAVTGQIVTIYIGAPSPKALT